MPEMVTTLPNPIHVAPVNTASFPFMKISSVFQRSLKKKKHDFSSSKFDKNYIDTADFHLLIQLNIFKEILECPVTILIMVFILCCSNSTTIE